MIFAPPARFRSVLRLLRRLPQLSIAALIAGDGAVLLAAPPPPPRGFTMVQNSPDSITLAWYRTPNQVPVPVPAPAASQPPAPPLPPAPPQPAPPSPATGFHLYEGTSPKGEFRKIASTAGFSHKLTGLKPGTTSYYKLSAANADGESALTSAVPAFTIAPWVAAPFPAKIARNMCVSLGGTVVCNVKPSAGKLEDLVDGWDGTSCKITGDAEVRIRLNAAPSLDDAAYLMLNFRTDSTGVGYAYNINWRAFKDYVITESHDSTDGVDGMWKEVQAGTNAYLEGVIAFPNNKPRWVGLRKTGKGDMQLCRLDVFRAAPEGFRNDYWIFAGDSLVVQDLAGGPPHRFSDLVRRQHPDRYPMVVQSSQGGEMLDNTLNRLKKLMPVLNPPNAAAGKLPTATLLCFESGFNSVGLGGGLWQGELWKKGLGEVQQLCKDNAMYLVPVRLEFATPYLNKSTLEPVKDNIFHNTLGVNLAGIDVFCRTHTPYACDPHTQLPYADYWTYTRTHWETALAKDGVHHTKEGADGINRLWAQVADKMIYSPQRAK